MGKRFAIFRKVESPSPDRIWYEVADPDTGHVVGRVTRWVGEKEWEGWVRHDSGESFHEHRGRTIRLVQHILVCSGKTRDDAARGMWDFLP